MGRFRKYILVSACTAVAIGAIPAHAHMHVALTKAEPGINDTVATSPSAIKLWFSEPVQAMVTGVRITGPGDKPVVVGAVHIDPQPKSPAVAPITQKLQSGKYTVTWKTMAEDGHPANGTYTFVVRLASKQ